MMLKLGLVSGYGVKEGEMLPRKPAPRSFKLFTHGPIPLSPSFLETRSLWIAVMVQVSCENTAEITITITSKGER